MTYLELDLNKIAQIAKQKENENFHPLAEAKVIAKQLAALINSSLSDNYMLFRCYLLQSDLSD